MRTPDQIVSAEVLCCVSSLISTLAPHWGAMDLSRDSTGLSDLFEQAGQLASPIDDWEEAAIQARWEHHETSGGHKDFWARAVTGDDYESPLRVGGADATELWANDAENACHNDNLEPYQREVFEHWAVTDWFGSQLEAKGEKVDHDFSGLCIWARTTTGQAIAADHVVERIAAELNAAA
jgi:hypothetical protein